ncbi:MAG: pyruvate kinase alpha/beta domain-containing protein, partial [Bacillota bacterium]|nr:pyruvate kinase alpha/beta domain-containing protein [Bacillota bacterium]
MENKIKYFNSVKDDNTEETFSLVKERLDNSGIKKIVLASTTGATARKAMDFFKDKGIQLIVIPHQFDFSTVDNLFPAELVKELRQAGHEVHFGTMLFHTEKLFGSNVPSIVANFLRCFCEGVKVCYEIVLMASDAGLLKASEKVIAIAGTGRGSDTALVMQAASSRNLKNLKVNEILCKPI